MVERGAALSSVATSTAERCESASATCTVLVAFGCGVGSMRSGPPIEDERTALPGIDRPLRYGRGSNAE